MSCCTCILTRMEMRHGRRTFIHRLEWHEMFSPEQISKTFRQNSRDKTSLHWVIICVWVGFSTEKSRFKIKYPFSLIDRQHSGLAVSTIFLQEEGLGFESRSTAESQFTQCKFSHEMKCFCCCSASFHMATACWCPWNLKHLNRVPECHLLKLRPSVQLCKRANCEAHDSGDCAYTNASASQCIPQ